MTATVAAPAERRAISDDFVSANRYLEAEGWTDGLPVIPPTEALVAGMLAHATRAPGEVLGQMEPLRGTVTVEKVAANAVMAGCLPEYFPVVLASVRAVLQPDFHVGSGGCTTGGAAPVIIVNGPIARRLGVASGTACFGGNVKPNATIGRALRLVLRNLGGARPDGMEKSTQAWPGKVTCCFAEHEARSPWEPLHVERGYPAEASAVTVVAVRGIYAVTEGTQATGEGVLETLVSSMRYYDYLQAGRLRARLAREFVAEVFDKVDVLIAPVIPEPAPPYEVAKAGSAAEQVRRMGRFSRLTRPWNALGLPALSVPCALSDDGRPLAFQIVGRPFAESTILRLGGAYELAAGWHARRPPLD